MNRRFMVALLLLATWGFGFNPSAALARSDAGEEQEEEETSNAKFATANPSGGGPDSGGIVIEPSNGKIAEGDTITITFPVAMVAPDLIDIGDQPWPFVSEPKLAGTFLWKSQTEGVFTVNGVVAGGRHRCDACSRTEGRDRQTVRGERLERGI